MHADRSNISATAAAGVGIVHLGLGAFFRAFGVPWICETMQASGGNWAVIGVSLRSSAVRDGLKSQSYDYTAMELGPKGEICRRIEGLRDVLVAPENPAVVLSAMVDPAVKIVSLTVTEKGYCHNPATGRLDFDHADIRVDLSNEMPRSALGFIVRALQRRRAAGDDPFTVMSCDNLPNNGELTRGLILDLAREVDADLAMWISSEVCFPSTMVDRIVPATKPEDVERVTILTGIVDASPVVHEPFRQWVIEDNFVGRNRPDFGAVGIEMVQDVTPFEHMKLRMLNGTHSAMAYLGYLAGHQTIAEVANDPVFERYVKNLWVSEIIPALTAPKGVDLQGYAGQLFARYSNPFIRHLTWQIAMDGSQKLPQRILSNLSENITAGRQSRRLLLAVAGWIRYIGGTDEQGNPIEVSDPLAQRLRDLSGQAEGAGKAIAILGVQEVFPDKLSAEIGPGVCLAYERLLAVGARNAVEEIG